MLRAMEESHSDRIHRGVNPASWVASAEYVNDYIMIAGATQSEIASRFGSSPATISRLYGDIVSSDSLARVYGKDLPLATDVEETVEHQRITVGMLAYRLSESTSEAKQRLNAAENNSDVVSEGFGGKTFYRSV